MLSKNSETLNAQVNERPLAKMQEELKQSATEENLSEVDPPTTSEDSKQEDETEEKEEEEGSEAEIPKKPVKIQKTPRKALLKNDDTELTRIDQVRSKRFPIQLSSDHMLQLLNEIHKKFFAAYDERSAQPPRRKSVSSKDRPMYDVTVSSALVSTFVILSQFYRSESFLRSALTSFRACIFCFRVSFR